MTGATSEAGAAYPPEHLILPRVIESYFLTFSVYCLWTIVCPFVIFLCIVCGPLFILLLFFCVVLVNHCCLNISIVINIKILTNSNQQTQSYKFTSHIAGFDHRDAWNLHTNIIWSKCSTDFKELSPCSVWYPLKTIKLMTSS
jgi:hypothetical protein